MTHRHVLAVGIDAAESTIVRRLMDEGRMPVLASLVREGAWRRVDSPSDIGSGSVWPTFITGTEPIRHGVYAEWAWQPETMGVKRYSGHGLAPFWAPLVSEGVSVGVFDVPFAPAVGLRDGFEVREWGPHDAFDGRATAGPGPAAAIVDAHAAHPFYASPVDPAGPHDVQKLEQVLSTSLAGVEARGAMISTLVRQIAPTLTLAVFNEIHHASHYLWHTLQPDHPLYAGVEPAGGETLRSGLVRLYAEVDRQIGRLLEHANADDAAVVVFSLHGMRPATGVAAFLAPWLIEKGFARLAGWGQKTWKERAVGAFGALKRHSPAMLKSWYYRALPPAATRQLAQPTMVPAYDWTRTRAFSLPTDQHGWIRINLRGREARGIVAEAGYDGLIKELETAMSSLADADGRPLVQRTVRTAASVREALTSVLPDLVVHWTDAALSPALRIGGSGIEMSSIGRKFTSQHALEGFCIARGVDLPPGDGVRDAELHAVIAGALRRRVRGEGAGLA